MLVHLTIDITDKGISILVDGRWQQMALSSESEHGRIERLINSPDFSVLSAEKRNLLREQILAANRYSLRDIILWLADNTSPGGEKMEEGVRFTGGDKSEEPIPFRD